MKRYIGPTFILLGVLLGIFQAALSVTQNNIDLKNSLEGRKNTVQRSVNNYEAKLIQNKEVQDKLIVLKDFNQHWRDAIHPGNNILAELDRLSFKHTIATSKKMIQESQSYLMSNKSILVARVSIKVSGLYGRIFNWLGDVESHFPHARLEELHFFVDSGKTALSMKMILPQIL